MSDLLMRFYHRLPAAARSATATLRGLYLRSWRYGAETEQLIEAALERERWSAEQWQAWREERLALLLNRAATRVPYYRELWQARRRAGDRTSWERLDNWPILSKETVRENPWALVADDCHARNMMLEQTSGTTGKPLSLWKSRDMLRHLYALTGARTRRWYGVSPRDPWARLGGQLVTPLAQRRPPFWVWNAAANQLYLSTFHLGPDLIPYYLDALARYEIASLAGYTSSLYTLAQGVLRAGRGDLRMTVVVTNAEPLTAHQRAVIAEAFHCPVRETYGMNENVVAASECSAGQLHQWPEVGIVEVTDDEFTCTGLLNADMPLIRYRVGDRGRLAAASERCACGRTLPIIAGVDGRSSDLLLTRDGRRVFWFNPVFYGLPVRESQIVQERIDLVRVRVVAAPDFTDAARHAIVRRLRERLGDVDVTVEAVAEIPRTESGKVRAVICEVATTARQTSGGPRVGPTSEVRTPSRAERVLVLDAHANQALACVRSLARAGYTVFTASHRRAPLAAWSRYRQGTFHLGGETLGAYAELRDWAGRQGINIVLPITERACQLCNAERDEWEARDITVGCAQTEVLRRAFDKLETIDRAKGCGVRVPATAAPDSLAGFRAAAAEFGYPCVIKPRFSNAWNGTAFAPDLGPVYVSRPDHLAAAVQSRRQGAYWPLIQAFVHGRGTGVSMVCDHGRIIALVAHERLREVRPSGSGSSLRRSVHPDPRLREGIERLVTDLEWHGPAMVEFRDDGDHPPWLMEVNGRFWGSLQLAISAGVDFPVLWMRLLSGKPVEPLDRYDVGVTVRWLWGDVKRFLHVLRGAPPGFPGRYPGPWQGFKELIGRQPPGTRLEIWDPRDPLPGVGELVQGLRDLLRGGP